jgi:hypothetical protein
MIIIINTDIAPPTANRSEMNTSIEIHPYLLSTSSCSNFIDFSFHHNAAERNLHNAAERNLHTPYGDGGGIDNKSPKGSVNVKICPLVNRHPDYVTLSSCSGRVALFDPTTGIIGTGIDTSMYKPMHQNHDDGVNIDHFEDHNNKIDKRSRDAMNRTAPDRTTNRSSGKGEAGRERLHPTTHASITTTTSAALSPPASLSMIPTTFEHEPPPLVDLINRHSDIVTLAIHEGHCKRT